MSFVGQYHPYRAWLIKRLRDSGCQVAVWGWGWKGGRVDFHQMANIFNESRINLNLSNNESWDLRYVLSPFRPLTDSLRAWKATVRMVTRSFFVRSDIAVEIFPSANARRSGYPSNLSADT